MIQITKAHGFRIMYNSGSHKFMLWNEKSEEIGQTDTQEQAETLAKKLSKEKFKPIRAFKGGYLRLISCTITSLNRQEGTFWYTTDKHKERGKGYLRSSVFYPQTETNKKIEEQLIKIGKEIEKLNQKALEVEKGLGSRINYKFFGMSE